MLLFIPKHISIHKAITSQKHMRNPSMWNPIIYLKTRKQPKQGNKANHITNWNKASTSYTYIKGGLNKQHACSCECMTFLTYLAASQHLWHHEWACECMSMALRLRNKKTNSNLAYERYQQIKHVNQRLKYVYTYEKGLNRGKTCESNKPNNIRNLN